MEKRKLPCRVACVPITENQMDKTIENDMATAFV